VSIDVPLETQAILSALLERTTGQLLMPNRIWRVEMGLKMIMRERSISDLSMLAEMVAAGTDPILDAACVDAMLNNESSFYRDQPNFALLTGPVLDGIRANRLAQKRLRIWSVACSTGQEPYSLAMAFADNAEKWAGWSIEIIASDISKTALQQAKLGRYSQFEIQRGLPVMLMLKHFAQVETDWILNPEVRNMVTFRHHNALGPPYAMGKFDLILCRNLLMYLSEDNRHKVLDNIADASEPDAMLMLGAAETVIGQTARFETSREFRGFYHRIAASKNSAPLPLRRAS
jgi:chemotaxis protein methyltransferase CheR